MSCAISARVLMWKLAVVLINIGVIWTCSLLLICFSGLYMLCMLVIVSSILMLVEYLRYISCRHILPLYMWSSTRYPLEFRRYPMALMMSGLWCCGRLFFGRSIYG